MSLDWLARSLLSPLLVVIPMSCAASSVTDAVADAGTPAPIAQAQVAPPPLRGLAMPSVPDLVDTVKGSVVNVEIRGKVSEGEGMSQRDQFFEHFFGQPAPRQQPQREMRAMGSGVIVGANGVVLTNNHVVKNATQIRVKLNDGRSFEGEVLGRDPLTDLAVVKLKNVPPGSLPFARLGNSDTLRVGEWVVAIGNPFGLASSVSLGIISAKERVLTGGPYDDFLQTDAAINPGNSGGPLFNLQGEVVGINTAISAQGSGIGFAIPSNLAQALIPQLEKSGKVTRGWLGVAVQDLTPELAQGLRVNVQQGAVVADVTGDTPAAQAGLKSEDVVTAVDGAPVTSAGVLTRTIALKTPGSTVVLKVIHEGKLQEVKVKLGTRPDLEGLQQPEVEKGEAEQQQKSGLTLQDVDPAFAQSTGIPAVGALIADVAAGSPAERAGLTPGTVIVEAAGKPVRHALDLKRILGAARPGSVVLLRVQTAAGKGLRALPLPK